MDEKNLDIIPKSEISSSEVFTPSEILMTPEIELNQELEDDNQMEYQIPNQEITKRRVNLFKKNSQPSGTSLKRDELAQKVENILAFGLEEAYQTLPTVTAQQEFKLKGEQTAAKISELLKSTKVKFKKIFKLITEWLSLLPMANKFFLEQEAKIKTDKIIALKKQQLI